MDAEQGSAASGGREDGACGGAVAIVVGVALAYATLRYNVLKGVAWSEWPTYVVNKAAALAALLLLAVGVVRSRASRAEAAGRLLRAARWLVAVHVTLSLALMGPASYPRYFADGKPTATFAWSLLLGAILAAGLVAPKAGSAPGGGRANARQGLAIGLIGLHAGLLGYEGWLAPGTWPGYLVPITLIAAAIGAWGLALAARPE